MYYYLKNIGIIARCTDMYRDDYFRNTGLNGRQCVCLLHICRQPGITQDTLSKTLFIDKSNVTRQMGLLEEAGYITRCPDEGDRRQVRVFPTEKAQQQLPAIREGFRLWREFLNETITEEEQKTIADVAERLAKRAASRCNRIVTEEQA